MFKTRLQIIRKMSAPTTYRYYTIVIYFPRFIAQQHRDGKATQKKYMEQVEINRIGHRH